MKTPYTISKIAKICETSKATVSRVLNTPELVSKPLRSKVLKTMEEVGYTPNPFAKNLGNNGTWGIALFVFDILNPFFALMVRQIGHQTMQKKIPLTVCDTENDIEKEKVYLEYLLKNKIGGIIFTEGISPALIDRARKRVPIVLIDQHHMSEEVPEVTSDNFSGAMQATEYLIQLNHHRIGFVAGPKDWKTAQERFSGYREALVKHQIDADPQLVFNGEFLYESGTRALEYFLGLQEWPTAIFCANDQMALGILNKAQALNISIPNDISLVGFDAIPLFGLSTPKLTTVKQDIPELCRHAVDLLLKQHKGQYRRNRTTVPTQLIVGETCKKIGTPKMV
jgi:LacI family transcriptional regulator/LacI family repressor for deo operon, udp, cdd, tsx, nupC, and nupG